MESPAEGRPPRPLFVFLAGLQAGMVGALFLLAWMGLIAKWQVRSFWTPENLMASVFYGTAAIHRGFAASTASGLALYLLTYSLLGALFAVTVQDRLPRFRLTLVSAIFALIWYYLFFHLIGKAAAPLVVLLHHRTPTVMGHVIFGVMLARYPAYLKAGERRVQAKTPQPAPEEDIRAETTQSAPPPSAPDV